MNRLIPALVAVAALLSAMPGAQAVRPNIILIQADDLGYGDLSAYGQTKFQTPSLDRLARDGVRFTQYYAGSTVCAPSRNTLMTGQHTGHVLIRGNAKIGLRANEMTLAKTLRAAGYRTGQFGKWGLGNQDTTGEPTKQGFDYSFGVLDQEHAHRQYTDHLYRNGQVVATNVERDYSNDLFTTETLGFIDAARAQPFFVYLNYTVPHAELRVPEDSIAPFLGRFPETPFVNAKADALPTGPETPSLGYRSQATPHAAFAAMITRMDRDIGRLVDRVHALGLDRRTLIMFVSDNGPHVEGGGDPAFFNSSGGLRGVKRDMYEGGIRVPMIARWSGTIPAGKVVSQPAAHWDLFPTFAELAGAPVPSGLDGMSIVRALENKRQPAHEFLYWEFHERGFQQAVRMGRWKAVRLAKDAPLELYDLDTDRAETHNVAAAHADVVARVERYLKTARTDSAEWPVK